MKARNYECHQGCPVEATLDLIGGRWKGVILFNLIGGPVRFNELRRRMPSVSQRVMTRQLRELEAADIVSRKVTPTVPPRVDYALTEQGATLAPVIQAMRDWGRCLSRREKGRRRTAGAACKGRTVCRSGGGALNRRHGPAQHAFHRHCPAQPDRRRRRRQSREGARRACGRRQAGRRSRRLHRNLHRRLPAGRPDPQAELHCRLSGRDRGLRARHRRWRSRRSRRHALEERGGRPQRRRAARWRQDHRSAGSRSNCRITACSTKSAFSSRVR